MKTDPFAPREDAPTHGAEKQAWKKQQRMIRNRESAALSRKRKRDRIESLEQEVRVLLSVEPCIFLAAIPPSSVLVCAPS